jgi:hypothetical protein
MACLRMCLGRRHTQHGENLFNIDQHAQQVNKCPVLWKTGQRGIVVMKQVGNRAERAALLIGQNLQQSSSHMQGVNNNASSTRGFPDLDSKSSPGKGPVWTKTFAAGENTRHIHRIVTEATSSDDALACTLPPLCQFLLRQCMMLHRLLRQCMMPQSLLCILRHPSAATFIAHMPKGIGNVQKGLTIRAAWTWAEHLILEAWRLAPSTMSLIHPELIKYARILTWLSHT